MKLNVGTTDRVIRAVIGIALIAATMAGGSAAWGLIGAVLLATAAVSFCPVYALLGKSTCKMPLPGTRGDAQ